jgi:hypothetical protein
MLFDILPDEVLLAIFDICLCEPQYSKLGIEEWQTLVHVCHRWRCVVFGSPRRLNLRLLCRATTLARDTLDVWPALPLHIHGYHVDYTTERVDNIIAALERSDRVYDISIHVPSSHLEKVSAAMQKSFPELTSLVFWSQDKMSPVLPDSFLGGSAPHLRHLSLNRIPFPGLPKLLLSATNLDYLSLRDIPHSGYFSPDVMATALSTLTNLGELVLEFRSPRSHPDLTSRRPPPLTRLVIPALTRFQFNGVSEYFDDLVARIDTPRLNKLEVTFFNQIIFDTPQFIQFISHTPALKTLEQARVIFGDDAAGIKLMSQTPGRGEFYVNIPCEKLDWQVSSLEQVCTWCLPPFSTLEDLYIYQNRFLRKGNFFSTKDVIENTLWLELLHPFTAVKNLCLSEELAPRIMLSLQELVGGRTTVVLPNLQNIFLEVLQESGPVHEAIVQFVAMRQVTGLDIAVSRWDNAKQDMFHGLF